MSFGTIPLSLDDKPDGFVLLSMYEKLDSENAKLRELVKDALPFFDDDMDVCVGGDCFAIGECCGSKSGDDCPAIRRMWERARELGVEVDG